MTNLRVALFTGNYHHVRDGVSLTLNRLVAYLLRQGVEVKIFAPKADRPALKHQGEIFPLPTIPFPGRSEYPFTIGLGKKAERELKKFNPDLVHIASPDRAAFVTIQKCREWGLPVVSSYHTHFASYLKYYKLEIIEPWIWERKRSFYHRCEHVYVPSQAIADELKEHGIVDGVKFWARGVDVSLFSPEKRDEQWRKKNGIEPDDLVILFVSRLVWEKDLMTFVKVIRDLQSKYQKIKPIIVGKGPIRGELERMLPNALFTGFLSGELLARAYASSDVFLFPSDTETFGNVTLEAMASGVPPVVANAAGSKSLVESGINGYLAQPRKVDDFYQAVEKLFNDKSHRKEVSRRAFEKAQQYSWERVNGQLLSYYYEVIEYTVPEKAVTASANF